MTEYRIFCAWTNNEIYSQYMQTIVWILVNISHHKRGYVREWSRSSTGTGIKGERELVKGSVIRERTSSPNPLHHTLSPVLASQDSKLEGKLCECYMQSRYELTLCAHTRNPSLIYLSSKLFHTLSNEFI